MPIKPPNVNDLARNARALGLEFSAPELQSCGELLQPSVAAYARLEQLEEPAPMVRYQRDRGQRPAPDGAHSGAN